MASSQSLFQQPIAFRINDFDFVQGTLLIPENSVWYRAYDPAFPLLADKPLYFGDMEVAYLYAKQTPNRRLGEFKTTKQLRLYDIRYVAAIMRHLYQYMTAFPDIIENITIVLGTCSLNTQIALLEKIPTTQYPELPSAVQRLRDFAVLSLSERPSWANPVELQGVRAGITNIDYKVHEFLRCLFKIDGIIAPAIPTPFHDQIHHDISKSALYEELVLFNPVDVLTHVQDRPLTPRLTYYVHTIPFSEAHVQQYYRGQVDCLRPSRIRFMAGGSPSSLPLQVRDSPGEILANDPLARKKHNQDMKRWMQAAKAVQKKLPRLASPTLSISLGNIGDA